MRISWFAPVFVAALQEHASRTLAPSHGRATDAPLQHRRPLEAGCVMLLCSACYIITLFFLLFAASAQQPMITKNQMIEQMNVPMKTTSIVH